jgi:hypothetical protein
VGSGKLGATRRTTRTQVAIGLALVVASAIGGCGGSTTATTTTTTTTTSHSTSSTRPTRRRDKPRATKPRAHGRPLPPVGRTQRVKAGSSTLSVTVTKLIDPLRDSGSALLPGTRAIGVMLTIRDDSGATYDSTASGDVSIVASSGMAAPLFIKQGVCQTPLTDFESLIGVGTGHSGCVGFALARGARVLAVRFSPHSRAPGTVSWR